MQRLRDDSTDQPRRAGGRADRRPVPGQRHPAADRRAAVRARRRRPGDRAPERHRAQGQVLPRGRRSRSTPRTASTPPGSPRPAASTPSRATSRRRPGSEPASDQDVTTKASSEPPSSTIGSHAGLAVHARRPAPAARRRAAPRRRPPGRGPSARGSRSRRSRRRAPRPRVRRGSSRLVTAARRDRLAPRLADGGGDVALLTHAYGQDLATATLSIAASGSRWCSIMVRSTRWSAVTDRRRPQHRGPRQDAEEDRPRRQRRRHGSRVRDREHDHRQGHHDRQATHDPATRRLEPNLFVELLRHCSPPWLHPLALGNPMLGR